MAAGWGWGSGCREGVKPHNGQLRPENRPKAFHKPAMRSPNDVILVQNGLESHQKWSLQQVALTSALLLMAVDSLYPYSTNLSVLNLALIKNTTNGIFYFSSVLYLVPLNWITYPLNLQSSQSVNFSFV